MGRLLLALSAWSLLAQLPPGWPPNWPTPAQLIVGITRPSTLRFAAQSGTYTATASWDPNPASDAVVDYRLYYGTAPSSYTATPIDVAAPATSVQVPNLTPGTTYYFAIQARAAVMLSALSTEVSFQVPAGDPTCLPPLGANALAIFPTALQFTGSGGAGSKARLDFQIGSPGSPVVTVAVLSGRTSLGSMIGTDLGSLAGLWFSLPTASGSYPLHLSASNAHGCTQNQSTAFTVTIP